MEVIYKGIVLTLILLFMILYPVVRVALTMFLLTLPHTWKLKIRRKKQLGKYFSLSKPSAIILRKRISIHTYPKEYLLIVLPYYGSILLVGVILWYSL